MGHPAAKGNLLHTSAMSLQLHKFILINALPNFWGKDEREAVPSFICVITRALVQPKRISLAHKVHPSYVSERILGFCYFLPLTLDVFSSYHNRDYVPCQIHAVYVALCEK